MRIVGGEAGGRRLVAPPGRGTRPTSDRVREAIFDVLGSLGPVVGLSMEGATVADLFAGSGALGMEALSRGAGRVAFVDRDERAVATIRANLSSTSLAGSRAVVHRSDAERWLATAPACDLVLCDPPYAFDHWAALLAALEPVAGLLVLEAGRPLDLGPAWRALKMKHYGSTVVMVAAPAGPPAEPIDQEGGT